VHVDDGAGLGAGPEERLPVVGVDRRQVEVRRDLAEAHGPHTALRVAVHLGGGQLGVPELHDDERDEATVGVAAPLLDHPVVVGLHAEVGQLLVLGLLKVWPQNRGNDGKHI
jgi:hypothetical protein